MALRVVCPHCGAVNDVAEPARGREIVCAACTREFPAESTPVRTLPRATVVRPPAADDIPVVQLADAPDEMPVADLVEPAPEEMPVADLETSTEPVPDIHLELSHEPVPDPAPVRPRTAEPPDAPQPPGLPFTLRRHERVLLRAGFGGVAGWAWVCTVLPMSLSCFSLLAVLQSLAALLKGKYIVFAYWLVCLPLFLTLGLWPLLRTGRYWLTTHRVAWKPRFGKLKTMWVEDVRTEDISGDKLKSKLTLRDEDRKIVLRYVSGLDRLWGGILVLANTDPDALVPSGKGVAEVAWWRGGKSEGLRQQLGLLVLRPEYVAFLPTSASKHLGVEFFKQSVGKAVREALGRKEEFPEAATIPFDVLIGLMSEHGPAEFDQFVEDAVEQFDGLLWETGDVEVFRESVPLRPRRASIVFRQGNVKLAGLPARDQGDTIDRVLDRWTDGEPLRTRYPFARTALVGTLLVGLTALLAYQGNVYDEPIVEVGSVTPAQVMDAGAAPEKSFVTVAGHIDAEHITHLKAERKNGTGHVLVVFRESPRLILHLPEDHDLGKAIKKRDTATGKRATATAAEELGQTWTVSGQLYTGGADGRPHTKVPVGAVREFAQHELRATDVKAVRVLMVDQTPQGQVAVKWMVWGLAGALGAFAALIWAATLRALVLGRTERSR